VPVVGQCVPCGGDGPPVVEPLQDGDHTTGEDESTGEAERVAQQHLAVLEVVVTLDVV